MINGIIKYWETKKRIKEFKQISKMNPDNLNDAIQKFHPTIIQSWKIQAANELTNHIINLIKKKIKLYVDYKHVPEQDQYNVNLQLTGYQIWKLFKESKCLAFSHKEKKRK